MELFTLKAVLFEFAKSDLTRGAKDTLGVAVRYLKDHSDVRVEIQGNTDSKGSDEYNMKLGMRRAEAVKSYLASQGVGVAMNGQREAGTEILLDGAENVGIFSVTVGNQTPIDSVQEYSVVTNNFSAEQPAARRLPPTKKAP